MVKEGNIFSQWDIVFGIFIFISVFMLLAIFGPLLGPPVYYCGSCE